jgi:hypothetical protein
VKRHPLGKLSAEAKAAIKRGEDRAEEAAMLGIENMAKVLAAETDPIKRQILQGLADFQATARSPNRRK